MNKLIGAAAVTLATSFAFAADPATSAKAVELACHRIENLVTLKKIDDAFETKFAGITVDVLPQSKASDPVFRVTASVYAGADGKSTQIIILMDNQARALSNVVVAGSAPVNAPEWPDTDSVNMAENSLHYVLEGWQTTKPEVKPFYTDLKAMRLTQAKDSAGQILAKAEFLSSVVSTTLTVYLKSDGSFLSAEVK